MTLYKKIQAELITTKDDTNTLHAVVRIMGDTIPTEADPNISTALFEIINDNPNVKANPLEIKGGAFVLNKLTDVGDSAIGTPNTGKGYIYLGTDDSLYFRNDDGTDYQLGGEGAVYITQEEGDSLFITSEEGDSLYRGWPFLVNHRGDTDELSGDTTTDELFPLDVYPYISDYGRKASPRMVTFFDPKIKEDGFDTYDNPWCKWNGRGVIGIFKETVNLVSDPESLVSSSSWNLESGDSFPVTLSDYSFDGHKFTKIEGDSNAKSYRIYQDNVITVGDSGDTYATMQGIFKRGTNSIARLLLYDEGDSIDRINIKIDFDATTVTLDTGDTLWYEWYGDSIVWVAGSCEGIGDTNDNRVYVYGDSGDTLSSNYGYATAIMVEKSYYPTPYTEISREAEKLDYNKSMPNQGTIECWVRPWFDAGTTGYPMVFSWTFDLTARFELYYNAVNNCWQLVWQNGGTVRTIDGTTVYTNSTLWNWIHLKVWWNISAGTGGLAVNGVTEDSTWSGALDAFTTPIEGLALGRRGYNDTYRFDGLITDFKFKNYVDTGDTHYTLNRPYYTNTRVIAENSTMMVDKLGNAYLKDLEPSLPGIPVFSSMIINHEEEGDDFFG